jgi:hypothetical protein
MATTGIGGVHDVTLVGGYVRPDDLPRLYDQLDFQRACQAYIWATPAVGVEAIRRGLEDECGLSLTNIGIFEHFLDAKTLVATGNGQSIYSLGAIDLSQTGPAVIEAPAGVQGFIMSLWQQPVEDIGPLGPDKNRGGPFLILPPGYEGEVPDGYFVCRSDTMLVVWLVRGFVRDGKPDSAVESIKGMRMYSLADRDSPPAMTFADLSGKRTELIPVGEQVNGLAYFATIARFVEREPVREQDRQFLGLLASLGIEKGKPFAPDERMQEIFRRAGRVGQAMTAAIAFDSRVQTKERWPGSHWEEIFLTGNVDFETPNVVELDARAALYYQAAGASKGALLDLVGAGSKYAGCFKDQAGQPLDGGKAYRLNVPANVPAKQFWSVTVYDAETRSMIDNAQGKSGRDSYQTSLQTNADSSVDLFFGPNEPAGKTDNWVQTNLGVGFFLYFRWYGPLETYFDRSWHLPDVERLDG